jgi:trans-aconitate methyltransferase
MSFEFDLNKVVEIQKDIEYDRYAPCLSKLNDEFFSYFLRNPDYYRLLTAIGIAYPDYSFLDIGTNKGASCLAYYYGNPKAKITTMDIVNCQIFLPEQVLNDIEFIICDSTTHKFERKYDIIFMDISHNGTDEKKLIQNLLEQGMLKDCAVLFDDIHLNPEMQEFWDSLNVPCKQKIDITQYGHGSGTGLLIL